MSPNLCYTSKEKFPLNLFCISHSFRIKKKTKLKIPDFPFFWLFLQVRALLYCFFPSLDIFSLPLSHDSYIWLDARNCDCYTVECPSYFAYLLTMLGLEWTQVYLHLLPTTNNTEMSFWIYFPHESLWKFIRKMSPGMLFLGSK